MTADRRRQTAGQNSSCDGLRSGFLVTLRYVLKNLNRRKIRTILMLLALIVGVGALVALNATVDVYERFYVATVSNSAGDYDLVITKSQIEPNLLIDEQAIIPLIQASDPEVKRVVPRIQGIVDVDAPQREDEGAEAQGSRGAGEISVASNELVSANPPDNPQSLQNTQQSEASPWDATRKSSTAALNL